MIKRVYGSFNNGPEVEFTWKSGDQWITVVPEAPDGEYVVSLWAEDEYGNTAYYATMLFIIKAYEVIAVRQLSDFTLERLDGYHITKVEPKYELLRIYEMR